MSDRELLELAALAAGIETEWLQDDSEYSDFIIGDYPRIRSTLENDKAHWEIWNPLTDDGNAFRLGVRLRISPVVTGAFVYADYNHLGSHSIKEIVANDPYAATRRAITRAAAEIGKAIKAKEGSGG